MYKIKEVPNKQFQTKLELINYIKLNKEEILSIKKLTPLKEADAIYSYSQVFVKDETNKKINQEINPDLFNIKVVINTTNWLDSHLDLHVPKLWNKSLKDNKAGFYLLEEHQASFNKVIGRNAKAYTESLTWKELGLDIEGITEALIFELEIKREDNPYMFEQYRKGYVNNHSVGMQYVKIELALHDEEDEKEMDFWNKYYPLIANKEKADEFGFFWVVSEAKIKEGSAVLFGSNPITPTLNINIKSEPPLGTQNHKQDTLMEPSKGISKNELNELLTFKK